MRIFEANGYAEVDRRGRFELMVKKFDATARDPRLIDWSENWKNYTGWHLIYADQCPWHQKSAEALLGVAAEFGIDLNIQRITRSTDAKLAPSGFGVFSLMHNGELLEDHYLSATRFRNILKKELA